MQAEPRPAPLNVRTVTGNYSNLGANQLDTRRYAGIFPFDISEVDSVDCNDVTQEERDDDFVCPSRSRFVSKHDNDTTISQVRVASVANIDERPLSEDSCYRRSYHATEYGSTEVDEDLVQIPDDRHSTCTVATSADSQLAMDMMWRPKPKIRMCPTDRIELIQAVCFLSCCSEQVTDNASRKVKLLQ